MNAIRTLREHEADGYLQGVARDRLLLRRCPRCARHHHPLRLACTSCDADELEWVPAAGTGRVYSFTVVDYRAPSPAYEDALPYAIGFVELDEGVYLLARLLSDDLAAIEIGARVTVEFPTLENGEKLPAFRVG